MDEYEFRIWTELDIVYTSKGDQEKQRQEDGELRTSLGYVEDPLSKKKENLC